MFEFKKAMKGDQKKEDLECECCGSMEGQDSNVSSGCASSCAQAKSFGSENPGKKQTTGCTPCAGNSQTKP